MVRPGKVVKQICSWHRKNGIAAGIIRNKKESRTGKLVILKSTRTGKPTDEKSNSSLSQLFNGRVEK